MLFPKSVEISDKERAQREEIVDHLLDAIRENVEEITEITRIDFELAKIQIGSDPSEYLLLGYPSFLVLSGVFKHKMPHEIFWMRIIHKTDMFTKQSPVAKAFGVPGSFEVESNYPERAIEIFEDTEAKRYIANMGEGKFSFFSIPQVIEFKETLANILELTEQERTVLREIDRTPKALIQNPTAMQVFRKALMKEAELTKFQLDHVKESWDLEAFEMIRRAERQSGMKWDDLKDPALYSISFCSETRDFPIERKAIYSLYAIHGAISALLGS